MVDNNKNKKEEECNDEALAKWSCPPIRNVTHPLRYYEFSPEEIKALEECDKESFYQRCIPFSSVFAAITYAGVKNGTFKPNPRFGAIPKVTLAVIVGYFLGKLSYQQACAEKLMAIPNSYIGQLLREKKQGRSGIAPKRAPTMFGATSDDVYSDAGPGSSLDLDTDRPLFNDDSFRPGSDSGSTPHTDSIPSRPVLSYDELRRKNRTEYSDSRQDPYKMEPSTIPSVSRAEPTPPRPSSTNKYGDTME
ncbi:OCIA domain-containing protein 1 isoform X2 [Vanessa cardui]|uniref:OCIA domain-containing protein 1 isoform X2 n=1 Tax=Vanessa cardui TaxID=171605 RepID=UPI001F13AA58|nr:OCIA domain-containing protein 1 isoform X2 [Vanessa cardui]